mgnify:CR=1 FL=1
MAAGGGGKERSNETDGCGGQGTEDGWNVVVGGDRGVLDMAEEERGRGEGLAMKLIRYYS